MKTLEIKEEKYTPYIHLDPNGLIEIKGRSYPENTFEFYKPVISWIEEYFKNPAKKTVVNFEIIYFNSSSSKVFFDIFDIFDENKHKTELIINWIYDEENDAAEEAGEDFIEDFEGLKINLIAK